MSFDQSWEDPFVDKDWETSGPGGSASYQDYEKWLSTGRKLADGHSGYQWRLGDWLIIGENHFDYGAIPGYLLLHKTNKDDGTNGFKAEKIPNYWRDASALVGIPVPTLKDYAHTARAYPKKKRFRELSFTHHLYAAPYEKRAAYLAACIVAGEKPHSIDWLWKHIRENEGEQKEIESTKYLRFMIPEDMWAKLKQLGKWYGTPIPDLVQRACVDVVQLYLDDQARAVSLEKFGIYEGKWPFYEPSEFNKAEAKKEPKKKKSSRWLEGKTWRAKPRRTPRKNDPVFSESQRQGALASWEARRARMRPVSIRRIA